MTTREMIEILLEQYNAGACPQSKNEMKQGGGSLVNPILTSPQDQCRRESTCEQGSWEAPLKNAHAEESEETDLSGNFLKYLILFSGRETFDYSKSETSAMPTKAEQ